MIGGYCKLTQKSDGYIKSYVLFIMLILNIIGTMIVRKKWALGKQTDQQDLKLLWIFPV